MITVNEEPFEWHEGLTVQQLLDRKNYKFKMLAVWINDSVVEKSCYADRTIPDGAVVEVIHNISGG